MRKLRGGRKVFGHCYEVGEGGGKEKVGRERGRRRGYMVVLF